MKNIKLLATALFLVFTGLCHAQQNSVAVGLSQSVLPKVNGEKTSVNIILKSQVNPAKVKARSSACKDRRAAREMAVAELMAHSVESQATVLEYLEKAARSGLVLNINCHWIANVITCDAAKEVVEALSLHPDVLAVGQNREVQVVRGFDAAAAAQAVAAASSHSATPHVLQVNADDVWAQGYTGKNIVVAILDSGTNPDHYDLKDHLWCGYADTDGDGEKDDPVNGWNFVANNADITDDYDLGYYWVVESGCYDLKSMGPLATYIDYEAFGRDVRLETSGGFTSLGWVEYCG